MACAFDRLFTPSGGIHESFRHHYCEDVSALVTDLLQKFTPSDAETSAAVTPDFFDSVKVILGGTTVTKPSWWNSTTISAVQLMHKKTLILATHVYNFLPRQLLTSNAFLSLGGFDPTVSGLDLRSASTQLNVYEFIHLLRVYLSTRVTGTQIPTMFQRFPRVDNFPGGDGRTYQGRPGDVVGGVRVDSAYLAEARSRIEFGCHDMFFARVAFDLWDRIRAISTLSVADGGIGLSSASSAYLTRLGLSNENLPITVVEKSMVAEVVNRFRVNMQTGTCAAFPAHFSALHKSNEKWQDAVDVVTAKARRSGIMTYVLLGVFLVYLFGSIFVLRSGMDPASVNMAIGSMAGMVCLLLALYYVLQMFRFIKPPVWLP